MKLFDVYPLYDICPLSGSGLELTDEKGSKYLDFYGGHAVISIGHSHPHFVKRISEQLHKLSFYSNSVQNPLQQQLADALERVSACKDYELFLCNSGAEANENALKLASFHTGKSRVIAFKKGFHGRSSAAVACTDDAAINAPLNLQHKVTFIPLNEKEALDEALRTEDVCAVIIEGIQGVGGLDEPSPGFYRYLARKCEEKGVVLIADEVQSGYGRTGKFFAFQHHGVRPHIISMAKGMGNGFPVGGILIDRSIKSFQGMLGTTFGGNHLACAAALAVLEVIEEEDLLRNAAEMGSYFETKAKQLPQLKKLKGRGLMLGLQFPFEVAGLRQRLIFKQHIFTGNSKDKYVLRVLPALNVSRKQIDTFFNALNAELS